jgi:hypothetical protein
MRILAIITLLCLSLTIPNDIVRSQNDVCKNLPPMELREEQSHYFELLFSEPLDENDQYLINIKSQLDHEYDQFEKFFGVQLNKPISIRFYTNILEFECSNAYGYELAPGEAHTSIGQREIAFVKDRLDLSSIGGKSMFMNAFRNELAGLFVNYITDSKAPAGLRSGIQKYAEDPQFVYSVTDMSKNESSRPIQSWRYVWENKETGSNPYLQLYALSITAYLIDTHGWLKFATFLNSIPKSQNYRQALYSTYQLDFPLMEKQWEYYFPAYFEERWQFNIFYNMDLFPIQKLIKAGAYIDAVETAKKTIEFLNATGQSNQEAQKLLEVAQRGEKVALLVTQARRHLLVGAYNDCIQTAEQALLEYAALDDSRRVEELNAYINHSQIILQLQEEVRLLVDGEDRDPAILNQLMALSDQLTALGDDKTPGLINEVIQEQEELTRAQQQRTNLLYSMAAIFLLVSRVFLLRSKQPPEVL